MPYAGGGRRAVVGASSLDVAAGTITDDMRRAGEQGDGLPTPAGMGPWPAVTQLIANPDNPSSYTTSNSSLASGSADGFPGDWSIELTAATSAQLWEHRHTVSGSTAGRAYSGQFRVIGDASSEGKTLVLELVERGGASGDAVMGASITVEVPATDTRFTITRTVVADDRTRVDLRARAPSVGSTWVNGDKYRFSWTQLELGSIATPFTPTSRVAGRIQAAVADLGITAETGAVFAAVNPGYTRTTGTGDVRRFMRFVDSGLDDYIQLDFQGAGTTAVTRRKVAAGSEVFITQANLVTAGVTAGVGYKWTLDEIGVSVNGANAATTAVTGTPSIDATNVDFGSTSGTSLWINSNIRWLVTFSDGSAVSNADWAALHTLAETLDRAPVMTEVLAALPSTTTPYALLRFTDTDSVHPIIDVYTPSAQLHGAYTP